MYLRKIVVSGFKSFADRVVLTFDKTHITGIVGPNGSGKSNVIDAVRWVMGEQNAKMLRGDKATDIIFSGSEKRKAQSLAEVSLHFDNREASVFCPPEYRNEEEVCLTRRIYRDGQREYLINQKPSRLRDIIGFFAFTGLGGRSYSMIQQGQVDRILQARPEQIREILEEACGTNVFKKRRSETLKRLEQTQQNLARVDDVLFEIDRQLTALTSQVEKARRWQELTETVRSDEIKLFHHSYQLHHTKVLELKKSREEEDLKEIATSQHLNDYEERQILVKRDLEESDPDLARLNETITSLRENIASHESSLLNTIKLVEEGGSQLQQLGEELGKDETNLLTLRKQADETSATLDGIDDEARQLRLLDEELSYKRDLHDEEVMLLKRTVDGLDSELRSIDKSATTAELRTEGIAKELARAKTKQEVSAKALSEFEGQSSQARILLESVQLRATASQRSLDEILTLKAQNELNLTEIDENLSKYRDKHDLDKGRMLETNAQIVSLEEMLASATDAKSALIRLQQQHDFGDCLANLADLVSWGERIDELAPAAAKAFEYWADRLLLRDDSQIGSVSQLAASSEIAPVSMTVLPKRIKPIAPEVLQEAALVPLSQFVQIDSKRDEAQLLERIIFFQDLEEPDRSLVANHDFSNRIIFYSDGSVSISAHDCWIGVSTGSGTLFRKQKLDDLREKYRTLQTRLEHSSEKVRITQEKKRVIAARVSQCSDDILAANKHVLEVFSELQDAKTGMSSQQERLKNLREDFDESARICAESETELAKLSSEAAMFEQQRHNTRRAFEDAQLELDELASIKEEEKRQHEQARFDLGNIDSKRAMLTKARELAITQLEVLEGKFIRQSTEHETLARNIETASVDRLQLEGEIKEYIKQRQVCESTLAERKDANSQLISELRDLETKIQECHRLIQKCQKIKNTGEVEAERATTSMEAIAEQAIEKYQIDLSIYEAPIDHEFRSDLTLKRLNKAKQEIEAIGPINMMALDEHQELTDRQEFIQGQREEIRSAMDLLETAIEEIEETSAAKFMATFEQLNREFMQLFPILFPRGEGHIQLTDKDKPLEGGVEILVRLPGKSRQNMRLFSGGEKALTAIALIFALLKSKPTPFCFLDEVDAPLDETNVGRYNTLLASLSDRFQFVVITHRRRTMEVLDTLYGVTMQEPGVSKIVGVDMGKVLPTNLQKSFSDIPLPAATGRRTPADHQGALSQ